MTFVTGKQEKNLIANVFLELISLDNRMLKQILYFIRQGVRAPFMLLNFAKAFYINNAFFFNFKRSNLLGEINIKY